MKNKFLLIAFIEGAFVMALELIGARLIAPFFGSSIVTWTVILSIVVFSLAIGYFLGGILSKYQKLEHKLFLILNATFLIIAILPYISKLMGGVLNESSIYVGVFAMGLALLLVPNILFGSVSPIIIELFNRNEEKNTVGNSAGKIYAISTVGGIIATYLFGFFIIPAFGLNKPLILTSLLAWIILFVLYIRYFQWYYILPLVVFVSAFFLIKETKRANSKYYSEGLLGQILVEDIPSQTDNSEDRILFVNKMGQTWVDKYKGFSKWNYPYYINFYASIYPQNSKVLLLGLGGGTIAKNLESKLGLEVESIELDARIKHVANKYFGYNTQNTKIDDARHYLRYTKKSYDIIIFDVFKGEVAPSYVLTRETFEQLKTNLKPNGMVLINFNGFISGETGIPARSVYATLNSCGYKVNSIFTPGAENERNILFIASLDSINFSANRSSFYFEGEYKTTTGLFTDYDFSKEKAYILTDDKPNLEILNLNAAQSWRKDYSQIFNNKILSK